jgi:hypothetical protein
MITMTRMMITRMPMIVPMSPLFMISSSQDALVPVGAGA